MAFWLKKLVTIVVLKKTHSPLSIDLTNGPSKYLTTDISWCNYV